MPPTVVESASAEQTAALAAEVAQRLAPGDVVLLRGEMGAGKTTFVRGAARALGFEGNVTSPTFTIGRRYETGRVPIAHVDLHRLASLDDEEPDLLDDYVNGDHVAFVEWPDVAGDALVSRVRVTLEHAGGDTRRVTVEWEPA